MTKPRKPNRETKKFIFLESEHCSYILSVLKENLSEQEPEQLADVRGEAKAKILN